MQQPPGYPQAMQHTGRQWTIVAALLCFGLSAVLLAVSFLFLFLAWQDFQSVQGQTYNVLTISAFIQIISDAAKMLGIWVSLWFLSYCALVAGCIVRELK